MVRPGCADVLPAWCAVEIARAQYHRPAVEIARAQYHSTTVLRWRLRGLGTTVVRGRLVRILLRRNARTLEKREGWVRLSSST